MHGRHSLSRTDQSQAIYGYPFETEDDVNWVMEQISGQIQALGGKAKSSREAVHISVPSGVQPEQITPLHHVEFKVMIF
jgi:hypothetical protein